mmetsp:Transcript_9424/g.8937  ORF Transcript_9424/g.8937 Transcript_9424/m.8937 type:complete len:192 (+) Transcript_9424:517-1092(+)
MCFDGFAFLDGTDHIAFVHGHHEAHLHDLPQEELIIHFFALLPQDKQAVITVFKALLVEEDSEDLDLGFQPQIDMWVVPFLSPFDLHLLPLLLLGFPPLSLFLLLPHHFLVLPLQGRSRLRTLLIGLRRRFLGWLLLARRSPCRHLRLPRRGHIVHVWHLHGSFVLTFEASFRQLAVLPLSKVPEVEEGLP